MRLNSLAHVGAVRIDIAAIKRGHCVTPVDGLLDAPRGNFSAPARVRRPIILGVIAIRHPNGRQRDLRIVEDRVIAAKIHADEDGSPAGELVGNHQEQVNLRRSRRPEGDGHFLQGRLAVQGLGIYPFNFEVDFVGPGRKVAIHVVLEKFLQLRPAFRLPGFLGGDAGAVHHHEWIGQVGVGRQFGDEWKIGLSARHARSHGKKEQ